VFNKNVTVLWVLILLLLCGCATHKSYDYANFSRSLYNDASFYSQYEIIYQIKDKKNNDVVVVTPFLADSNAYLPEKIIKLHLGLNVVNPYKEVLNVWVDYTFRGIDNKDFFQTKSYLYKSVALPEEFLSIDMPYSTNIHSQIEFFVTIEKNGKPLYESSKALYRVKGD
jgi:hypothetical protein